LVFGEESNLPFNFRKVAENISDFKTVCHLLDDLNILGYSKVKLVMDRGFYSEENINDLYRNHLKFLISVKMSLAFIRKELIPIYDSLQDFKNYNDKYGLYCKTVRTVWHYSQERPYNGETLKEDRRLYIHYYYNIERAAENKMAFDRRLNALKQEQEIGKHVPEHEKLYL
jgi:transposase